MLNHNTDFENRQVRYKKILVSNAMTLGALAWRGYQLKGRGAILIYNFKESEDSFEDSIDVEIGYLSKEEAGHTYCRAIGLFKLMDDYNPNKQILVAFTDRKNSLVESYRLTLLLPPMECYIMLQERILNYEISDSQEL